MNRSELNQLLETTLNMIRAEKTISNDSFAILITMFPTVIASALEILDHGKVTKIQCLVSKRFFYKVKESSQSRRSDQSNGSMSGQNRFLNGGGVSNQETTYESNDSIFDVKGDFCFCYYYARECLNESGSAVFCKHVLACKLAEALESIQMKEIEDKDYAPLFLQSKAYFNKYDEKRNAQVN